MSLNLLNYDVIARALIAYDNINHKLAEELTAGPVYDAQMQERALARETLDTVRALAHAHRNDRPCNYCAAMVHAGDYICKDCSAVRVCIDGHDPEYVVGLDLEDDDIKMLIGLKPGAVIEMSADAFDEAAGGVCNVMRMLTES